MKLLIQYDNIISRDREMLLYSRASWINADIGINNFFWDTIPDPFNKSFKGTMVINVRNLKFTKDRTLNIPIPFNKKR